MPAGASEITMRLLCLQELVRLFSTVAPPCIMLAGASEITMRLLCLQGLVRLFSTVAPPCIMPAGTSEIECEDWDTGEMVTLALDPTKTAVEVWFFT